MFDVYGAKGVNIEIPPESFPTQEERDAIDAKAPGSTHGWFESSYEESKLHYVSWVPKDGQEVRGVIVFLHGIASHCNKATVIDGRKLDISYLSDECLKRGIALYTFDHLGHGFSEGTRMFVPDWKVNQRDAITFCNMVSKKFPQNIPLFVAGESYGGSLAIHVGRYFQDHPDEAPSNFDSLLLTAPFVIADIPPFPIKQVLQYVLAPMYPRWTPFFMPNPVASERIWRDTKVLKERTDPRYREMALDAAGLPLCLGTAVSMVLVSETVRAEAIPGLMVPFCSIHGTDDIAVLPEGSKFLMDISKTLETEKEYHQVEGAYHELFSDPAAEEGMGHWMTFIEKRTRAFHEFMSDPKVEGETGYWMNVNKRRIEL